MSTSGYGTDQTNRAGFMISVLRGRSEVAGVPSEPREWPKPEHSTLVRWLQAIYRRCLIANSYAYEFGRCIVGGSWSDAPTLLSRADEVIEW